MRNRHSRAIRRLPGAALVPGMMIIAVAALAGCSTSSSSSAEHAASGAVVAPAEAPAPAGAGGKSAAGTGSAGTGSAGTGQDVAAAKLAPGGQQLIYTAQLTVRAGNVGTAVSRATSIVADAGGYVSAENASSDPQHPDRSTATVEFKIPVAAYFAALGELSGGALGTRLSLRQQAQDVTQQVADVGSRVASDRAAIAQLRALLSHAGSVGDLLSVQNQINSEESDLEAMQAQQRALDHQTAYATVSLSVLGPKAVPPPAREQPPPGLGNGLSGGWHAFRVTIGWLLAIAGAVAPFAAVAAIIGFGVYRVRRWRAGRAGRPADGTAASGTG